MNAVEDRIVSEYFDPYSITLAYWALAFVFLYLGLQKVVPHRSAADVQLATIGGTLGLPYIPFVAFIGAWQMTIGTLFLLRRLRLCAWFFFSYQAFTFGTLLVLRKVVFQPPWLTVFGFDIPWALGAYAAFILKNTVFAAVFFVLATQAFDTSPADDAGSRSSFLSHRAGTIRSAVARKWQVPRTAGATLECWIAESQSLPLSWPWERVAGGRRRVGHLLRRVRARRRRLVERSHAVQDYLVTNFFRPHGVTVLYLSYGIVWFYFGMQKPAPVYSPVRHPLSEFLPHFGIPLEAGMVFIGTFEMFLGLLFVLREIRVAFWLFFGHQAVTLLTLFVIPFVAFQPPYVSLHSVRFPWALTGYGAFVIKNLVFIAGFMLLASIELGDTTVDADGDERDVMEGVAESGDGV